MFKMPTDTRYNFILQVIERKLANIMRLNYDGFVDDILSVQRGEIITIKKKQQEENY